MEGKIFFLNDKIFIQMFLVQINDFVLIKMDTLSLYSHGIPMEENREWLPVSTGKFLEQII